MLLILLFYPISSIGNELTGNSPNTGDLTISEILYEISASKFYNQVIEVYNNSEFPIKITDYILVSESRTNEIEILSSSKQNEFSFLNGTFTNEFLAAGAVAVILDSGYRSEARYDFQGSAVYTVNTTSFSSGRFLKPDETILLLDGDEKVVDSWTLKEVNDDKSLVKIDLTQAGYPNNLISSEANLGVIAPLEVTLEPFDRITLEEINGEPQTIGIPQSYSFVCRKGLLLSVCSESFTAKYEEDIFKLYHYPSSSGSRNLVDETDEISLSGGTSGPIRFWPINLGVAHVSYRLRLTGSGNTSSSRAVPDYALPIQDYPSPFRGDIFLNEIFYNTNKNLVWLEVAAKETVSLPLEVHLWNSDFNFKKKVSFPEQVFMGGSYNILAFSNADFTNSFSWHEKAINAGEVLDLTASGVVALSDGVDFIDSAYYDKNWYDEVIAYSSLQRKTSTGYAFTKDNFSISTREKYTPLKENDFSRGVYLDVDIENPFISKNISHLEIGLTYPVSGDLSILLYDTNDALLGRVYAKPLASDDGRLDVLSNATSKNISLCLTKANLVIPGRYRLAFAYDSNYGSFGSSEYFYFEL